MVHILQYKHSKMSQSILDYSLEFNDITHIISSHCTTKRETVGLADQRIEYPMNSKCV